MSTRGALGLSDDWKGFGSMSDLKEYTVDIGGVEHTMLLDEADAKRRGATPVQQKSRTPQNKAATPENKKG